MLVWPSKDPQEVLDYQITWTARLAGDPISTSTWAVTPVTGLTIDSSSFSNADGVNKTIVWLSSGTLGVKYVLTNHVVTAAGRVMEESVSLKIKAQ